MSSDWCRICKAILVLYGEHASLLTQLSEGTVHNFESIIFPKNNETNDKFNGKIAFLRYTERVNFRIQNKNVTWALGCHPRDNGYVTH